MFKQLYIVALVALVSSCGDFKPHPVTWDDVAQTIPADPAYVVSVNTGLVADSALNDLWAKPEMMELLELGLSLDSVRPDHVVVVAMSNATFITWPLPSPRAVAKKAADWQPASLNNTVDGRMTVRGRAGLVLSSTQAWVVNNVHCEKMVNELLDAAMNTKAAHVQPYNSCITGTPAVAEAVVHYEDRYYAIGINHEDGLLRVDVDAYTKSNKRVNVVDGLGRLPVEFVDEASPVSPFAAVAVDYGTMPDLLKRLAKLTDKRWLQLGASVVAPAFHDAAGDVTALWNDSEIEVRVPFRSRNAAVVAGKHLRGLLGDDRNDRLYVSARGDTLNVASRFVDRLPRIDADRSTPHRHSQTENPCAIAFARFDVGRHDPVELYFELAPEHARLQVDFKENKPNLAAAFELVKTLVFKVL